MPKNITHGNALSAVMEDYLEAVYHICKKDGYARSKKIAEWLNVDKSTVTTAMHALKKLGFIDYAPYRDITLTEKGNKEGMNIVRRHEVLTRMLNEIIGLDKKDSQTLACEWEHCISPEIAPKFLKLVDKKLAQLCK